MSAYDPLSPGVVIRSSLIAILCALAFVAALALLAPLEARPLTEEEYNAVIEVNSWPEPLP